MTGERAFSLRLRRKVPTNLNPRRHRRERYCPGFLPRQRKEHIACRFCRERYRLIAPTTHPKIAEVQVVGLPDTKLGEVVCAWIRLKNGQVGNPEDIREFCRHKIAPFTIPQRIRFVDSFPMTVTGKVQKYKIREFELGEFERD